MSCSFLIKHPPFNHIFFISLRYNYFLSIRILYSFNWTIWYNAKRLIFIHGNSVIVHLNFLSGQKNSSLNNFVYHKTAHFTSLQGNPASDLNFSSINDDKTSHIKTSNHGNNVFLWFLYKSSIWRVIQCVKSINFSSKLVFFRPSCRIFQ